MRTCGVFSRLCLIVRERERFVLFVCGELVCLRFTHPSITSKDTLLIGALQGRPRVPVRRIRDTASRASTLGATRHGLLTSHGKKIRGD